jgi:hypothetical protein
MYKVTDWDKDLTRGRSVLSSERAPHSGKHSNGPKHVVEPEGGKDTKMERPTDWPSVAPDMELHIQAGRHIHCWYPHSVAAVCSRVCMWNDMKPG